MKAPQDTTIFDRKLIISRRKHISADHFLLTRCAEDAAERILDVNRNFENVLIIGHSEFAQQLMALLPEDKLGKITLSAPELDEEHLPFTTAQFDLIISGLTLHQVNDLPGMLVQIGRALIPDGLFIGAMFGGQTLTELRQILYQVDDALHGGITPRIYPMADFQQLAGLLQRTGFAQPVVDTDRVTVSYANPMRLFSDLKAMGESNALIARSRKAVSKRFFMKACASYQEQFSDDAGKAVATFEILWLTGWSKHDSQQKPLRPGSAKMRLADALGTRETKL